MDHQKFMYPKVQKIFLLSLLIATTAMSPLLGQTFVFKVLASKGSNEYKSGGENWEPVKRGVSFRSGDIIKVVDDAYLGLIHNSGKMLELTSQGTFGIEEIESALDGRKKGIGARYTEYVINTLDESTKSDAQPIVTTRGVEDRIQVFLPISSSALKDVIHIYWEKDEDKTFVVTVKDMFDEVIAQEETPTNSFHMDLSKEPYADQPTFAVSVSLKDNPRKKSGEHVIDLLTEDDDDAARKAVEELKKELDLESPLDHLVLAGIYEEVGLLINATYHHQQAIAMAPDVTDYQQHFQSFIKRKKLGLD